MQKRLVIEIDHEGRKVRAEADIQPPIRVVVSHVVVRRELRARKFPPQNRAWNISRYIHEKRREHARLGGRRVYRQKILHSCDGGEMGKRQKKTANMSGVKDDERIVLYLLWHDHRPLRIVNVGDRECHRLWDIGEAGRAALRKRSQGERKREDAMRERWWGKRTMSPWGSKQPESS